MVLGLLTPFASTLAQVSIPNVQGTALSGTIVVLRDALKGKVGVLVLGFSHASQGQVSAWGRRLNADYGQSRDVMYFEIPMLAGAPKMLRGMIVKSMGKAVPQSERSHFLPMIEGEPAWRAVAHYDKPDDAYVLIVDGTGTVHWQTEGDGTDVAYADFKKNLAAVMVRIASSD